MKPRRQYLVVGLAVFAVALCLRTVTLYWSPFPATLDGFDYAALARDTIAAGHLPLERFRADNFVFAGLLTAVSLLTDVPPVEMAQPMVAVLGAVSCLTAVAVTRRIGRALDFSGRQARYAAVLAGLTLAVEGLYLRRTGVADEEALGLLLVPLFAIALNRAIRTRRAAWVGVSLAFVLVFPLVHTFSTLLAALTAIGVLTMQVLRTPPRRVVAVGGGLVGGFWGYFALYYEVAARAGITVPYVGRVFAFPGLFVAWLVVLVLGVLWVRSTSRRLQRMSLLAVVGSWYAVLVANVFLSVFPGTVSTPWPILVLALPFVVPVVLASRGLPLAVAARSEGAVVIALLAAPIVQVYFSLTASLTPEFFGTVMRAQTFVHFPIFVLAALAAVRYVSSVPSSLQSITPTSRPQIGRVVVGLLIVSTALTAPLAFVNLDTATYPSTTTHSEFAAATFAAMHVPGRWTAGDPLERIGSLYYPDRPQPSQVPVGNWLTGGSAPQCPTLSRASWTTTGAHLFPQAPATIDEARYERWLRQHNLVYSSSGPDSIALTRPVGATRGC
jgi:hypothetical protein